MGTIVRCDHPVPANDTFERDQVFVFPFTGRVGRHVHVAAIVVKVSAPRRGRQPLARPLVELEHIRDLRGALAAAPVDIDPQQL